MTAAVTSLTTIHAAIAWLTIAGAVGVTTLAGTVIDLVRRRMAPQPQRTTARREGRTQ